MKPGELLRLVWMNIIQNKFKTIMTSIGIIVGAATIVMVIAIGKGGKEDVADQFKNLNAGAIDISYDGGTDERNMESGGESTGGGGMAMPQGASGGFSGNAGNAGTGGGFGGGAPSFGGDFGGGGGDFSPGEMPSGGDFGRGGFFGGGNDMQERMNQENITLDEEDVDDIETFAAGVTDVTISYTTRSSVDGGELEEAATYTIGGVKENYADMSNLSLALGEFITEADDENKEKICVLGASVAEEIFGSAIEAYGSVIYIDERSYVVNGVLETMGTVSSGISPDDSIFIPYATGVKYLVGTKVNPTITVLAEDVNNIDGVIAEVTEVLAATYPNAEFTFEDAGSKMEAAAASNEILTMLLIAMAAIVFVVGGIGIMNVLFVSVKERTNEIGILKAIGCSQKNILFEFLCEAAAISLIGGVLGVGASLLVTPVARYFGVRVELSLSAFLIALLFAVGTGTIFGFYPAYKASKLVPVEALGAET
ncbi:MAG: ABC transporter permease [Roseburia sp.]|nr:ABC transporter permease [Roseburia sp.]